MNQKVKLRKLRADPRLEFQDIRLAPGVYGRPPCFRCNTLFDLIEVKLTLKRHVWKLFYWCSCCGLLYKVEVVDRYWMHIAQAKQERLKRGGAVALDKWIERAMERSEDDDLPF